MIVQILLIILGFVFLIKGADIFVDGAASTARNFKVSKLLIGITIVAFGTSAPELAVSIKALTSGSTEMVLGNIIGSNIINILLIIGIAGVIYPITLKNNTVKKELPLCMLMSTVLVVLFLDNSINGNILNQITRSDGIIILLFFAIFLYYIFSIAGKKNIEVEEEEKPRSLFKSILFILAGLTGIILGSNIVVNNAVNIAQTLGVSERMIALTIIALGTSLPELVTTIVSALKKEQDILIGNIIGSNIFNICIVLGIPVALFGTITPTSFKFIDLFVLLLSSVLLYFFAKTGKKITRFEALIMLGIFVIYYVLIFII